MESVLNVNQALCSVIRDGVAFLHQFRNVGFMMLYKIIDVWHATPTVISSINDVIKGQKTAGPLIYSDNV